MQKSRAAAHLHGMRAWHVKRTTKSRARQPMSVCVHRPESNLKAVKLLRFCGHVEVTSVHQ
eukprot:4661250-Pleurochrysis_carterae.AAC.2